MDQHMEELKHSQSLLPKVELQKLIIISCIMMVVIILLALAPYVINFMHSPLSSDPTHWGVFGDYIGGVIGTVFSALATILALASIYVSLKVAVYVQKSEQEFHKDNVKRETKRFDKEIELVYKQNKPYPHLPQAKSSDLTSIKLRNSGTGPLVVTKLTVKLEGIRYGNFHDLITQRIERSNHALKFTYSLIDGIVVLSPDAERDLLSIVPRDQVDNVYISARDRYRKILAECIVEIEYQDIFENNFSREFELKLFKN